MGLIDGSDATINQKLGYQAYNRIKNHFPAASEPSDLRPGQLWYRTSDGALFLKRGSGPIKQVYPFSVIPEGMIMPWIGGYFSDGSNGGYTRVRGTANTAAAVNALLNALGWYVCDGAELNLATSTIFNGPGRYLPNLTDDRFLMGDTACGTPGGSNSSAHTHGIGSYAAANESAHTHTGGSHQHGSSGLSTGNESSHTHTGGSHQHGSSGLSTGNEAAHTHTGGSHQHGSSGLSTGNESSHTHGPGSFATIDGAISHLGHDHGAASSNVSGADISPVSVELPISWAWDHVQGIDGTSGSGSSHSHSVSGSVDAGGAVATGAGSAHNHSISGNVDAGGAVATGTGSAHNHSVSGSVDAGGAVATGAGSAHSHGLSGTSGAASATENRPAYLSCFYLIYVLAA